MSWTAWTPVIYGAPRSDRCLLSTLCRGRTLRMSHASCPAFGQKEPASRSALKSGLDLVDLAASDMALPGLRMIFYGRCVFGGGFEGSFQPCSMETPIATR